MTQLHIKNMVCDRCIYVVGRLIREAGLQPLAIRLGEVQLENPPGKDELEAVRQKMHEFGFEILSDQKSRIISKIKTIALEYLLQEERGRPGGKRLVFSDLLTTVLHKDYSYLSKLFSGSEGITIEKYLIRQKIEKVKEWLAYDELSLSEMADKLGYSGVAHLSSQFKKTTGFTPSAFRKLHDHRRRPLDKIGRE